MKRASFLVIMLLFVTSIVSAQSKGPDNKFAQLKQELPTPNVYRTASGAPGPDYYQQRVDYKMDIVLDEEKLTLTGNERVTYYNNSPQKLTYLWMQLDQNVREQHSISEQGTQHYISENSSFSALNRLESSFDGGFKIGSIKDLKGKELHYTINNTMLRIELAKPLNPGAKISFDLDWWYNINNRMVDGGRSGYEHFEEEDNYIFAIAQFFPRMCVYNETEGWQNYQFLGRGEFTLDFGNYDVNITVPSDHVVGATGTLVNSSKVLTENQRRRLELAKSSDEPVLIVDETEAKEAEGDKATGTKTWSYHADNVRDFAFASSRKFIWDAKGVEVGGKTVMAMSLYPKEGNPLWGQYSTEVVAHTLETYSKYTIDYPYPVAYSIHTDRIGMEYPMICFNGGRPDKDGTYSESTKWGMIRVIIHEVGHNFFPMIINSDERLWGWMDEGLNTFFDGVTAREFDGDAPGWSGMPTSMTRFMSTPKDQLSPIMLGSEPNYNYGPNAYQKPATGLNILRETIMGRELFDYAMKEYARRWAFKHPNPADFFRTMEDASGVDLDWFWRGWFFGTDNVDISIKSVQPYQLATMNPEVDNPREQAEDDAKVLDVALVKDKASLKTAVERNPNLKDFYNFYDKHEVTKEDIHKYEHYLESLSDDEKALLASADETFYYHVIFENKGGLVMPLIVKFIFEDGSEEIKRVPAEIWQGQPSPEISKVFKFNKAVKQMIFDPNRELADVDTSNNYWPANVEILRIKPSKRGGRSTRSNPMRDAKKALENKEEHTHPHPHN